MIDHYYVLGIKKTATDAEIRAAFHKSAMEFHPDKLCALTKKLEKQNRTAKDIEIIKGIYEKKYTAFKHSFEELTEKREEYDALRASMITYSSIIGSKSSETGDISLDGIYGKADIKIEKTDLVSKFDEDKFNDLFIKTNKKNTNIQDKLNGNLNKAYKELLEERDNIEFNYTKISKFDIEDFNNNFFKEVDIDCPEVSNDIVEYEDSTLFSYKNGLAEISGESTIDTNNANNSLIPELFKPARRIDCDRKLINLKDISSADLEYKIA